MHPLLSLRSRREQPRARRRDRRCGSVPRASSSCCSRRSARCTSCARKRTGVHQRSPMKPMLRYTGTIAITAMRCLAASVTPGLTSALRRTAPQPPQRRAARSDGRHRRVRLGAAQVRREQRGGSTQRAAAVEPGQAVRLGSRADAGATGTRLGVAEGGASAGGSPSRRCEAPTRRRREPGGSAAAGRARGAAPAKPTIVEVVVRQPDRRDHVHRRRLDGEVAVGTRREVRDAGDRRRRPEHEPDQRRARVAAGQTKCLQFNADGVFMFHSDAAGARAAITARQWYDILVNKQVEDLKGGNFWMPKAVNLTADDSDLMYYRGARALDLLLLRDRRRGRLLRHQVSPPPGPQAASRRPRTTTRSRSPGR